MRGIRARVAGGAGRRDSGAAAVEFALILPILLVLVFGIIDFGRLYFTQITLTDAAREGARVLALESASGSGYTTAQTDAQTRAQDAATGVDGPVTVTTDPATGTCTDGQAVTVKASTTFDFLTPLPDLAGILGISTVTGTGVMRCGG